MHELPDVVDEAFKVCLNGKPGSVHIDLPKCITAGKYENCNKKFNYETNIIKHSEMNENQILETVDLINHSKRPVILAGQGCNDYSNELRKFAIDGNIPVTTTIHAMGVFDETHPLSLEFLGMHGNVAANYAIQNYVFL